MDQTLKLKLQEFEKLLLSLEEVVKQEKTAVIRDSVIKRFEYTFEIAWKTAKVLLEERFGAQTFSPKDCFRALRANQLISDEDTEALLKMTDDRNEVIHTYKETFAEALYQSIKERHAPLLRNIFTILSKKF